MRSETFSDFLFTFILAPSYPQVFFFLAVGSFLCKFSAFSLEFQKFFSISRTILGTKYHSRQILQNSVDSSSRKNNGIQVASNNVPCESKKSYSRWEKYKAQFLVIMVNSLQHMLTPPKGPFINYVVSKSSIFDPLPSPLSSFF